MEDLTRAELRAMLKEIDQNYNNFNLPEIEPIYVNGKLQNEKEIREKLETFAILIGALWVLNNNTMRKFSRTTMRTVLGYYTTQRIAKGYSITEITPDKWNKIIDKAMRSRARKVRINTVIKGNAKRLNKKLQKQVVAMYKDGRSKPQIAKMLQKELGYNAKKAKSIAMTEVNYYKSEAQLQAIKGVPTKKIWVHNGIGEPRETHLFASGQVADEDGYFNIGGYRTEAPQHFGIASEDVNCHCSMRVEIE